jgi:hypothetical protein
VQVKVEGHPASHDATFASVPTPASQPVSPLTTIRALRTQFSGLESGFKFPTVLDFEDSELAVTSNNAAVRTYEHALNGILERLDAIESDGDEELRDVRRDVVREVERALEDVERKVKERAPQVLVPEATKEEASTQDVESDEQKASATQEVPPVVVVTAEDTKAMLLNVDPVVSQADADIAVAISEEYQTGSPVTESSEAAIGELRAGAKGETSTLSGADTEAVPASGDVSDSTATITPTRAAPAPSASNTTTSTPPAPETFLTSMSHDQFTFPPRPVFSQSNTGSDLSGVAHDEDAVLVDNSSEGGSEKDGWTEFDA